jgi:hypothetical protein
MADFSRKAPLWIDSLVKKWPFHVSYPRTQSRIVCKISIPPSSWSPPQIFGEQIDPPRKVITYLDLF